MCSANGAWRRRLTRQFARALVEHRLLAPHDRILVALSGGKDSWALLDLLLRWSKSCPFPVHIAAVHIALGPDADKRTAQIALGVQRFGVPLHIRRTQIAETVRQKLTPGCSPCALCSRLRRGALLKTARTESHNVIALGHHADDMIETFLLNLFFTGRLGTMPAAMTAGTDSINIIRPMCYCANTDITSLANSLNIPYDTGVCALGADAGSERLNIRKLLAQIAPENPHARGNILRAIHDLIGTKNFRLPS